MKRPRTSTFDFDEYAAKTGLDPQVARAAVGVLMYANTLATERYNGKRLHDLSFTDQRDLVIDATDQLDHYKERHS